MSKKVNKYLVIVLMFSAIVLLIVLSRTLLIDVCGLSEEQASTVSGIGQVIAEAVAAVMIIFQLEQDSKLEEKQNDIEEAQFILQYNQAFIQDSNMSGIETLLERHMLGKETEPIITEENRQQLINYLVYLEGLAPLILRDVLKLEHIDDLMAYRFFLAMNNKEVQKDQLFEFPEYYRGCLKVYSKWKKYRVQKGREILMEENSIDNWLQFEEYIDSPIKIRNVEDDDDFKKIAELIFGVDPYIYPKAFGDKYHARCVLPEWICDQDTAFCKTNIKIAVEDEKIVGMIVSFERKEYKPIDVQQVRKQHPQLPKTFERVCEEYFNHLPEYLNGTVNARYISCLCVDSSVRSKGIGTMLLKKVLLEAEEKKQDLYLHVLAENVLAINLYKRYGFAQKGNIIDGYACGEEPPKCYLMERIFLEDT